MNQLLARQVYVASAKKEKEKQNRMKLTQNENHAANGQKVSWQTSHRVKTQ